MLIQLHLPDNEVQQRLDTLGYITEVVDIPVFSTGYHNRDEFTTREQLQVVQPDGVNVPAKEFLENILDSAIMDMLRKQRKL